MNAAEVLVFMFSQHLHNAEHEGVISECQRESCVEARELLNGWTSPQADQAEEIGRQSR
jgi:hypothetical protein